MGQTAARPPTIPGTTPLRVVLLMEAGNSTAVQGLLTNRFCLTATLSIRLSTLNSWCTVEGLSCPSYRTLFFR